MLDDADYTGPIRQHGLDHTRSGIDMLCLTDLHQVGIDYTDDTDHLSEVVRS